MTTQIEHRLLEDLKRFFKMIAPAYSQVQRADGVKELWLQGELFRFVAFSKKGEFIEDYVYTGDNKRDIVIYEKDDNPSAIIEVKVLTADTVPKFLTGYHDMRPIREGKNRVLSAADAEGCHKREGSVLKDFRKLIGEKKKYKGSCVGILLAIWPGNAKGNKALEAFERIEFGSKRQILFRHKDFEAVAWVV